MAIKLLIVLGLFILSLLLRIAALLAVVRLETALYAKSRPPKKRIDESSISKDFYAAGNRSELSARRDSESSARCGSEPECFAREAIAAGDEFSIISSDISAEKTADIEIDV